MRTAIPGLGWKLDLEEVVMTTFAAGVSVDQLVHHMPRPALLSFLQKVNRTRIQLASIFDLLVAQGDRHGENAHMMEDGNLMLIDNFDKSFFYPNSLFLPRNFISERLYVGNSGLRDPRTHANMPWSRNKVTRDGWPMLTFDVRCHSPARGMRAHFPPGVKTCLAKLRSLRVDGIQARYSMPHALASMLHRRATLMATRGFEKAHELALLAKPVKTEKDPVTNGPTYSFDTKVELFELQTFPWRPPCCKVEFTKRSLGQDFQSSIECVPAISKMVGNETHVLELDHPPQ